MWKKRVEQTLATDFALFFDGWSASNSTHYIGVFASFLHKKKYQEVLLACAPLLDEQKQDATSHVEFLTETLRLYKKDWSNVVCVVADHASVNPKICKLVGVPFVGCTAHRFNLVVRDYIDAAEGLREALDTLDLLMTGLRKLKVSAKLRTLTTLRPLSSSKTRWLGYHLLLERYFALEKVLCAMEEARYLLPGPEERRCLEKASKDFSKFASITTSLQKPGLQLGDAKWVFAKLVEDYPVFQKQLGRESKRVINGLFEEAVAKIQCQQENY